MAKKKRKKTDRKASQRSRAYVSQGDVPGHSIDDALRIPRVIVDNYAKEPTKPLRVAEALGMGPSSSQFRMLCGASIAYGFTEGGCNAELISLEALGRRVLCPTAEGDDVSARRC